LDLGFAITKRVELLDTVRLDLLIPLAAVPDGLDWVGKTVFGINLPSAVGARLIGLEVKLVGRIDRTRR
jgi:hypothetical protein